MTIRSSIPKSYWDEERLGKFFNSLLNRPYQNTESKRKNIYKILHEANMKRLLRCKITE